MKRDARIDDMLAKAKVAKKAKDDEEEAKVVAFVESGAAPFVDDVVSEMVALSGLTDSTGQPISLSEVYERATWANPGVRALLLQRAALEAKVEAMREIRAALAQMPKKSKRRK